MLELHVGIRQQPREVDKQTLAAAFRSASDAAYRAVRQPVEGTMLSVIREMAEEGESAENDGLTKPELLTRLVRRGEEAVARTPEQLEVLREAGVVDAGGAGLLEIVRGLAATAAGEPLPEAPAEREELNIEAIHQELSPYRYCTTFMIEGVDLDSDGIEHELEQLGDSLLVVGDPEALKVHVHTDEPGRALSVGTRAGVIDRVEIANMHEQTLQREHRLLEAVPRLLFVAEMICGVLFLIWFLRSLRAPAAPVAQALRSARPPRPPATSRTRTAQREFPRDGR